MKSAKKILLLVLSLVLLVGICAVAAFADDSTTATVVYPDGTVDTYTEAGAITPSIETQDGLYYGKGNTLYKDAGAGWIYTDEAGNPVAEITADLLAAGAKITASGFDKVYATVDITITEGDYVIWLSGTKFVLAGTTTAYDTTIDNTSELEEAARKIPVGNHKLYLSDENAVHNFLNYATCSFEINGVTYNYQDLRSVRTNTVKVTMYEDGKISTINWDANTTDRPATKIDEALAKKGKNYPASVLLDLNGHVLKNKQTTYCDVQGMVLYVYSSQAGAHYDASASTSSMFRTNNDAAIVLGDDNNVETAYADNISFHCKAINEYLYGTGIAINGGHFYQTAPSANGMINVSRRVGLEKSSLPELSYTMENASFYLLPGSNAVLNNATPSGAGVTIKNCAFYTSSAASLLYTAARDTKAITVTADGCSFYGVAQDCIKADEATEVALTVTNNAAEENAVTYNTVTWYDGTTSFYYATSLDEAKAFVETHPKKTIAPIGKEVGDEYFAALNPTATYAYDASFNAVQSVVEGELTKVYFTITDADGITYHTTDTAHTYLTSANIKKNSKLTLYADVNAQKFSFKADSSGIIVELDLNGYNVTVRERENVTYAKMYVYSSKSGAHFYTTASNGIAFADDGGTLYLGADPSGNYANNISFHTAVITTTNYGNGTYVIGGHYYQTEAKTAFLDITRRVHDVKNATFYLYPGTTAMLAADKTFTAADVHHGNIAAGTTPVDNCTFYSADGNTPVLYSTTGAKPVFTNCKFYGVSATVSGGNGTVTADATNTEDTNAFAYKTISWFDGTKTYYNPASLDAAKAFAESHPKAIVAPYAKEIGTEFFEVQSPVASLAYDASFNAVQNVAENDLAKIYFAAYVTGGNPIFFTNAETAGADFKAYMGYMSAPGATVVLYSDITTTGVNVAGKAGSTYRLDLNGYTLTITSEYSQSSAMDVDHDAFYLYSSKEGGVLDTSKVTYALHSNDGWYGSDHTYAKFYVGEYDNTRTDYGKNLTVYCKAINGAMHGSTMTINGGTFVQSEGSTAAYFLLMGRTGDNSSHVQNMKNATFVLTNPATVPFFLRCGAERTFDNCTFISANANGGVALSAYTDYGWKTTFKDCNFVNVQPYFGSEYIAYEDSAFGTTGIYSAADVDISGAEQFLAHGTTPKEITVLGKTYVLDGVVTTADKALKLSWGETGTEYWLIGSKPAREVANITKREGGVLLTNPAFDLIALNAIDENGIVTAAGEETVAIVFTGSEPLAFLYVDTKTSAENYVLVSECDGAVGIGNKFYEIFNAPISSYVITLYADMTLSRGIAFGALNAGNEYQSLANGDITLDLNGKTLAIAEDFAAIDPSNADSYDDALVDAIFVFEQSAHKTFTITSSAAGAKIINPTTHPLIAVGEQDRANIVIEGDYLEVVSAGTILLHVEPGSDSLVSVIGGKYTYTGKYVAFSASNSPIFKDFILELTNPNVAAAFASPNWSHETVYTIENVDVYATAGRPDLYGFTTHNTLVITNSPARSNGFTLNITDCELINVNLTKTYARTTVNFAGSLIASTMADLLAAIPTAPEGKTAAFFTGTYGVKDYKVCTYTFLETGIVEWGFGLEPEIWILGDVATHEDAVIDNVFTYSFDNTAVAEATNTATARLVSIATGVVRMNLTLQSKIGLNLLVAEVCNGATVTVNGQTFVLSEMEAVDGYYVLSVAIAPNAADESIPVTVSVNGNVHKLTTGIGNYAMAVLASEDASVVPAKKLTYAMIEYVRAMNGNADFCKDAVIPDGYDNNSPAQTPSDNAGTLLSSIAFKLDTTIAIAVQSAKDGETFVAAGKEVVLTLATGRIERATVGENGIVLFEDLYVNDFFGEMTIEVDGETYTYRLENYAFNMDEAESAVVIALYNYAYYADDYVRNVVLAQAN